MRKDRPALADETLPLTVATDLLRIRTVAGVLPRAVQLWQLLCVVDCVSGLAD